MEPAHPDLLADILAFCATRGLTKTEFGKAALNDPKFVFDLEAGRECRRATIRRVQRHLTGQRSGLPADARAAS